MSGNPPNAQAGATIDAEIAWFSALLELRLKIHAGEIEEIDILALVPPPKLRRQGSPYADGVLDAGLDAGERLVLILAMLPYLRPQALDLFLITNQASERRFTEFGGMTTGAHSGFRPTRETALFLLGGESMYFRLRAAEIFMPHSALLRHHILDTHDEPDAGPWLPLAVSRRWATRLTRGGATPPDFGPGFPAQLIDTQHGWHDLVLDDPVREEVHQITAWVRNEHILMKTWHLNRQLKPGYRALFYGPPGTGKTMTAGVLGGVLKMPVYRVDLSRIVSKYIGETEKNLAVLFDHAAFGDMILFFDEADALFGKRTETNSSNDRHANQQIAYLLQRIEDCPGVVILASNLKANIDSAFSRRLQAAIRFGIPDADARLKLWKSAFAGLKPGMTKGLDLVRIARDHELAGGAIINVLRYAALRAIDRSPHRVTMDDIATGIDRELRKEGRLDR